MRRSFFAPGSSGSRVIGLGSGRAGNVIGGGDWSTDRLIPDIVRAFGVGEKVIIRSPEAIRPWQLVLEPIRGYLMLAHKLYEEPDSATWADGWNFGPHDTDAQPVRNIVASMVERWGDGADWEIRPGGPHEAHYLKLDVSKARSLLGWQPVTDLATALEFIVEFHRAHLDGTPAADLVARQLDAYEARL